MSNQYFEFKKMRIEQSDCAMKVSTDACIQGAWIPIAPTVKNVLDIGTGTGLLALMLAQRGSQLNIDAIEIDIDAANQAAQNIKASPFAQQINILQTDARTWKPTKDYDLIICNPPFFTNSLQGPNAQRNAVRHSDSLNQNELAKIIYNNLSDDGYAAVLWPKSEQTSWIKIAAANNLFASKALMIKPFQYSEPNRVILICSKRKTEYLDTEILTIYQAPKIYTPEFSQLMRPFYLNL